MIDPNDLEILGPRILVKMDEEKTHFGDSIIVKPESIHETAEIEGTVLKVGTGYPITRGPDAGKTAPIDEIDPGDKVCFIKFHGQTVENPQLQTMLGEGVFLIKVQDVLYVRKNDEGLEDKS